MAHPNPTVLVRALTFTALLVAALTPACGDDATPPPATGTATLTKNTGLDLTTGQVVTPGNYRNSDLFATENGSSGLRLATGGANPTDNRPIVWFRNAGNVLRTFASLSEVPTDTPSFADTLPNAKTGYGCVLRTAGGDHVRCFVSSATATSVTIEWDRLVP